MGNGLTNKEVIEKNMGVMKSVKNKKFEKYKIK